MRRVLPELIIMNFSLNNHSLKVQIITHVGIKIRMFKASNITIASLSFCETHRLVIKSFAA